MDAQLQAAGVLIQDLQFGFQTTSVPLFEAFSLNVRSGEFVCVMGSSGCGKSTLLRLVAGLLQPTAGSITVDGWQRQPEQADHLAIGFVFQDARLLPWRRIVHNVIFGMEALHLSKEQRLSRAQEALTLVGLEAMGNRWPHQLSGGQKQRVAIARALAVRPLLLLMDEPFGSLDAYTRRDLQDELLAVWKKTGKTILFVTHDRREAEYLADRIITLNKTEKGLSVTEEAVITPRPRSG